MVHDYKEISTTKKKRKTVMSFDLNVSVGRWTILLQNFNAYERNNCIIYNS